MWFILNGGGDGLILFLVSQRHGLIDRQENRKEQLRFEAFQVGMEAVEVEGIESMLEEISIEEEEGLVRDCDSVDIMKSKAKHI